MMPPWFFPPPPPPRKHGFTRGIFVTLATTIFGISLLLNMYLLLFGGIFKTSGTVETVLKEGAADQKVVVLPVHGVIMEETAAQMREWLRKIAEDGSVKAVVLDVDTPGGTVSASDEIYHRLLDLRESRRIPIIVSMGGLATSGGYYISCAADQIIAQPTTWTGNIGVLMPRYNMTKLTEKIGVAETTLAAPSGGYKNAGSPFQPDSERDTKYLQALIDSAFSRFKEIVETGRGSRLKGDRDKEIFTGQVFTAAEALQRGLIDPRDSKDPKNPFGYLLDACEVAAGKAQLKSPTVVRYQRRSSLLETLLSSSGVEPARASGGSVNVNVNIDPRLIEQWTTPRAMYLWRGQ